VSPEGTELFERRWTDPSGRLGGGGPELQRALEALERDGRSAYVALLPPGEVRSGRRLWTELGLSDQGDLLLLYDGSRWEARGWGLDDAEISRILDESEPSLRGGDVQGLLAALRGLQRAAYGGGVSGALGGLAIGAGSLAAVALTGGLGWILMRRMRLQREGQSVAAARTALQDDVAHLVLSAESLGQGAWELQERAVRLQEEVRRLPAGEDARMQVARIERLQDEVAALQSQVLAAGHKPTTEAQAERARTQAAFRAKHEEG
jgi:hypothetical protein